MFLGAGWGSDLARPGAALYGINPTPGAANPMRLAVRLTRPRAGGARTCRRAQASATTPRGSAPGPSRIATAAIGYADGLHRSLSNQGQALF